MAVRPGMLQAAQISQELALLIPQRARRATAAGKPRRPGSAGTSGEGTRSAGPVA